VVDRKIPVEDLLQVLRNIAETEVQALQRLQLGGYACGERADSNVTDVAEEVFDADFFGFFSLDLGGCMYEGLIGGSAVLRRVSLATFHMGSAKQNGYGDCGAPIQ
jgi:hypothetical protein